MKKEIIITKRELGAVNIFLKVSAETVKKIATDEELREEGYLIYVKYPGFVKPKGGKA